MIGPVTSTSFSKGGVWKVNTSLRALRGRVSVASKESGVPPLVKRAGTHDRVRGGDSTADGWDGISWIKAKATCRFVGRLVAW